MGTAARALGTGVWSNCAPGRRPGPVPLTTVWSNGAGRRPGGGVWLNGMLRRPGRCSVCSLPRLGAAAPPPPRPRPAAPARKQKRGSFRSPFCYSGSPMIPPGGSSRIRILDCLSSTSLILGSEID